MTTTTAYPFAHSLQVGDIVLTPLASNPHIIYTDTVEDVWEYDEMIYVRTTDNGRMIFALDDVLTVIRTHADGCSPAYLCAECMDQVLDALHNDDLAEVDRIHQAAADRAAAAR